MRGCSETSFGKRLPEKEGGCTIGGFQPAAHSLASLGQTGVKKNHPQHPTADTWASTVGSLPVSAQTRLQLPALPLANPPREKDSVLVLVHASATRFTLEPLKLPTRGWASAVYRGRHEVWKSLELVSSTVLLLRADSERVYLGLEAQGETNLCSLLSTH